MLLPSNQALAFLAHSYDYLILGGGTAGLTVATRLALSSPSLKIGVLEAGHSQLDNPLVSVPGYYGFGLGTELDYNFTTTPQTHVNNRKIGMARGKMLGGSSGLNYMNWNLASAEEYDSWGHGWGWGVISKAVRAIEGYYPPELEAQFELLPKPPVVEGVHGTKGPVQAGWAKWFPKPTGMLLKSLQSFGIGINPDAMSGDNLGGYYSLGSVTKDGERSYSASAYLAPNIDRENLIVLTGATVAKVLLKNKVAVGVEFVDEAGTTHQAFLKKGGKSEVILSAGSLQSPQILELSGIGKKSVLEAAGVLAIVQNDQVGENLQDHIFSPITWEFTADNTPTRDLLRTSPAFLAAAQEEYNVNRSGILTGTTMTFAMLPLDTFLAPGELATITSQALTTNSTIDLYDTFVLPRNNSESKVAQIEYIFAPFKSSSPAPSPGKTYFTILIALMHPLSRGSVHISSASAFSPPVIDPRFFSELVDREVLLAGVRFAAKVAAAEPLKSQLLGRTDEVPDDQLWEAIKTSAETVKHPVGTCAIGTVVDGKLRVKGVKGLRVVDASVIPLQLSTHTQVTVYAIAEHAVKIILGAR
ncbi:hypothetical protein BZA05DRAFT_333620 [Tricharina praecox]|uniref:uncharacterized protein n=1 Tax=Tricharina praecox TaxID=43433 RepID=UPI00221F872C|nr:uncharacterized protein BZA05DRAFT_333620 [Tricharina praecox]KAI5856048.1 hypothetical protein BZA05DRAFT_333620 [Tricharina praecox]